MIKVNVYNTDGKAVGKVDVPKVFSTLLREDLILRAVLASQSNRRQPYGTDVTAGMKTSAHYHGRRRRVRWTMMGREMARMSRLHGKIPGYLMYRARKVPQSVKGRRAHPPKVEKVWRQKMNKKERKLAIKSAIAATADKALVADRGHKVKDVKELPIIVNNDIEALKKTADVKKTLQALGLKEELKRIGRKKIRAGKGKVRGRKYKKKIGPLIVVADDKGISKAVKSMSGVDAVRVGELSVEALAPGAMPGRVTIWSKGAFEKLK
jgi:large subunit ribosomal protein L4e